MATLLSGALPKAAGNMMPLPASGDRRWHAMVWTKLLQVSKVKKDDIGSITKTLKGHDAMAQMAGNTDY